MDLAVEEVGDGDRSQKASAWGVGYSLVSDGKEFRD